MLESASPVPHPTTVPSATLLVKGASLTALVIEDNPDDRFLLSKLLDGDQVQLQFAGTVAEAGRVARATSPGVVLVDLNLPDARGLETLTKVRNAIPGVPIVVMTGDNEESLALAAVREGAQDFLVKGRVDTWKLTRTLRYALERHRLVMELEEARARESHRATHDALTGLPNRALFDDRLRHAVARSARQKCHLAVVYMDLDGFKPVNDRLGHAAGDDVLIGIARRLAGVVRNSDTIARLGGDEFAVLLEDVTSRDVLPTLIDVLRSRFTEPILVQGVPCEVGTSLGIAFYPDDGVDAHSLMQRADARMYADKAERTRGTASRPHARGLR
jgi:diguanylate cyclase (GGDEF)-like protein